MVVLRRVSWPGSAAATVAGECDLPAASCACSSTAFACSSSASEGVRLGSMTTCRGWVSSPRRCAVAGEITRPGSLGKYSCSAATTAGSEVGAAELGSDPRGSRVT